MHTITWFYKRTARQIHTIAGSISYLISCTESHDPLPALGDDKSKNVTKIINTWFDVDQRSTSTSELFVHVLFAKTSSTRLVAWDEAWFFRGIQCVKLLHQWYVKKYLLRISVVSSLLLRYGTFDHDPVFLCFKAT